MTGGGTHAGTAADPVAELRHEIAALEPVDDRERRARAAFLAALDRLDAPFDEHADRTHVTASAIVLSPAGVVLHRHKRLGVWLQPGGHVDPAETPAEAAVREVREETGLVACHAWEPPHIVHIDVHPGGRGHTHLDVRYLLHAPPDPPAPPAGESQRVGWYPLDEAIGMADPGLRGYLQHLAARDRR